LPRRVKLSRRAHVEHSGFETGEIMRTIAVGVSAAILVVVVSPSSASAASARRPHFRTPQAAMRYLARAYNAHDDAALRHVTSPEAREGLNNIRREAINLRLSRCTRNPNGMAYCTFTHDFRPLLPGLLAQPGGFAEMRVAPARQPGWVAKGDVGCG
jgi:Cu/Ag efflux pump CusA